MIRVNKRSFKLMLSLTFLIFSIGYIFSAGYGDNSLSTSWSNLENYSGGSIVLNALKDWRTLSEFSLVISVIMMGIMYMIGEAFDIQLLKYYFRVEFKDIFANAILIASLILIFSFLDYVATNWNFDSSTICDGSTPDYNGYCLDNLIYEFLSNTYLHPMEKLIIDTNIKIAQSMQSTSLTTGADDIIAAYTSLGSEYDFSYGLYPLIIIKDYYDMAYVALSVTLFSLRVSKSLIGPALIALGVILRPFFFTKRIGSTIMAIGFGIMVIYPFFMYLFYYPFFHPLSMITSSQSTQSNCPEECNRLVVATDESGGSFTPKEIEDEIEGKQVVFKENNNADLSDFFEGRVKTMEVHNQDGTLYKSYLSCENLSIEEDKALDYTSNEETENILLTTYTQTQGVKEYYKADLDGDGDKEGYGLYCFPQCRVLPYPDDSIVCRDAESACRALYMNYPGCFKKMYYFSDENSYNNILEFYGLDTDDKRDAYESNCPRGCRSIPSITPPSDKDADSRTYLSNYCPSVCREINVEMDYSDSNSFSYSLKYPDKIPEECKDKYDCDKWYETSDSNLDNSNIYKSDEWSNAITSLHSDSPSIKYPYYSIELTPKSSKATIKCAGCLSYPKPLQYYPVYIDCSSCISEPALPSISSSMNLINMVNLDLGKILFLVYGIPLVALIASGYAVAGLSSYLQGDMFIPAINKIMR